MRTVFDNAAKLVREADLVLTTDIKLTLYGLYKHVTSGPCHGQAPPIFAAERMAKHKAWIACLHMTEEEAMRAYIDLAASVDNSPDQCLKQLLQESNTDNKCQREESGEDVMPLSQNKTLLEAEPFRSDPTCAPSQGLQQSILRPQKLAESLLACFGVKPIFPRGQLEISFSDLRFAAVQCLSLESCTTQYLANEAEITKRWTASRGDANVIVGLSVRTLFDLYLRCKAYPAKSEVIVVPPINIPGMMDILRYHDLKVVGVDIPKYEGNNPVICIDINGVKAAVTGNTVAIMVVHPFGIISASENEMEQLCELVEGQKIDVIEDCAECFTGLGPSSYLGSKYAVISFFSFGTIKTSTALGGGVGTVRDESTFQKMKRKHMHMYNQQKQSTYFRKIMLAMILKAIAGSPVMHGLLFKIINSLLGIDTDELVSSLTGSFQIKLDHQAKECENKPGSTLITKIRLRPCPALLALLKRRLDECKVSAPSWNAKKERCELLRSLWTNSSFQIGFPIPSASSLHTYWLYPVLVHDPVVVSRDLLLKGFDVPRGLSKLGLIDSEASCPLAKEMMASIVYLPVSHPQLSEASMRDLVAAMDESISKPEPTLRILSERTQSLHLKLIVTASMFFSILARCAFKPKVLGYSAICMVSDVAVFLLSSATVVGIIGACLRWVVADSYVNTSNCFAKHCSLLDECTAEESVTQPPPCAAKYPLSPKFGSLTNPTSVLITGATGFVGSSLLHNLLNRRKSQLFSGYIVILCRPKYGKSVSERIEKLLDQPMFSFISVEERIRFIKVVMGDVSKPNAGLNSSDMKCLSEEWNVGIVFHCAASVSFTQSLEEAALANITPALALQSFTKRLFHPEAKYIHISTAFVHGSKFGTPEEPLAERLFSLGQYNAVEVYRSMQGTQFYAESAMTDLGFPNTYTFSKCICEHLLLSNDEGESIIIRPSIVGPAFRNPYEGWAGERPSTIVAAVCLQMKSQWNIWDMGNADVPYIPVDITAQFIAVKAFDDHSSQGEQVDVDSLPSSDLSFERISIDETLLCVPIEGESTCTSSLSSLEEKDPRIFHATWDVNSSQGVHFSWRELAFAVNHVGSFMGYFTRFTAYGVLIMTAKIIPALKLSRRNFELLHSWFIKFPIAVLLKICGAVNWEPRFVLDLKKLLSFLDLPVLFTPFTKQTFCFRSEIPVPKSLSGDRYLFTCLAAAHRFLSRQQSEVPTKVIMTSVSIAGQDCPQRTWDLWWALTQPKGSIIIRIAGFILIKLLRAICTDVTIDVSSFSHFQKLRSGNSHAHLILAPTHRSVFDFLIISFIAFALPELNIKVPFIVAAAEFSKLPIIGWLASRANAFFVTRGGGHDPSLLKMVQQLKRDHEAIEVFIEGTRSRDRRFAKPRTGFLRCLVNTGGDHLIVPICINYEKLPEQAAFAAEENGFTPSKLNTDGLLAWLCDAFSGRICIGRIHVSSSDPIMLSERTKTPINFQNLATQIQSGQKQAIAISNYHISAAAEALNLDESIVNRAVAALGCRYWPEKIITKCVVLSKSERDSPSQLWSILLHFGHLLAPSINVSHPKWGTWLDPSVANGSPCYRESDCDVGLLTNAMLRIFDRADELAACTVDRLQEKGFSTPKFNHVLQSAIHSSQDNHGIPILVLRRAVETKIDSAFEPHTIVPKDIGRTTSSKPRDKRIFDDNQALGMWGYMDSRFVLQIEGSDVPSVVMKGSRYHLCGKSLKRLIPFIENETKCRFNPFIELKESNMDMASMVCPPPDFNNRQLEELRASVPKCSIEPIDRLRHGTGQTQEDIYMLRTGVTSALRLPDIVVWPSSEEHVEALVSMSKEHGWCLLPFGGGTNVSHATRCPSKEQEPRPIISVDMKMMSRIRWINEEDGLAHVEAGITGKALGNEMRKRGYCFGHEPDSLEFSTLGGWIATKASGMKRGKYGNIEDIVKDVHMVGAEGLLATESKTTGRSALGLDLVSLLLGSEGCLGIITSATIRIWPLPESTDFESVILPDFGQGILFARDMAKLGPFTPASVRLLDNDHFRLGQALHADGSLLERATVHIAKTLSPRLQMASKQSAVCATIMFEGKRDEVCEQKKCLRRIVVKHGGVLVGPRIGLAAYELTFSIAYLRDFALTYHFLGDSFETFAPWSKLEVIISATKRRIRKEHLERSLPGFPFIACRITQLYHEGVCVYFYVCMNIEQVTNPSDVFTEIAHAAREEILMHGGSLSHHHGIGKIRAPFLDVLYCDNYRATLASVKKSIDPENVFGARNGIFS